jgi:hypothetical protein
VAGLTITGATLLLVLSARGPIVDGLARNLPDDIELGPVNPADALDSTVCALLHGGAVFGAVLALTALAARRPWLAEGIVLIAMTLDLGVANARLVWTVPQAVFDAPSRAAQQIVATERERPEPGPFRVHRLPMRHPDRSVRWPTPRRLRTLIEWKRDSLEPLFGPALGLEQTLVQGILESDDYLRFFGARLIPPPVGVTSGASVYAFPRHGLNLWNSRYVLMPVAANGWMGASAGYERIDPPDSVVTDPAQAQRWVEQENWQLLRNKEAFPRAWLVHLARVRPPIRGRSDPEYRALMKDLIDQADPLTREPGRPVYDLRAIAFVETEQPQALLGYVSRTLPGDDEWVTVTGHAPQRVELDCHLARPGLVVLADTYYPGWQLTIDGAAAPIYRTNRLMRGAAVKEGRHKLVYTYNPASFRLGAGASIVGLIVLVGLVPWALAARRQCPRVHFATLGTRCRSFLKAPATAAPRPLREA